MRTVNIGRPANDNQTSFNRWVEEALTEIERASYEEVIEVVADDFTLSNITVTRTLDPTSTTLAEVANVLATFINDIQNRGDRNA